MINKRSLIDSAVRCALMAGAAATMAGYTPAASAANSNAPAQLGKVTVTGTRIKRTDVDTAQPITRISRQQIQNSGYTNVGQFLGRLSFAGGHTSPATNFNSGTTQVNLRNLGANRTLVLVNGKRWIQGLGDTTNLNTIPTSIIDHIEILQDGASAVYGSDAVAGVVNIITQKNFRGAEGHAYYGIRNDHQTGHWDGQTKQYDFTIGAGNDRGNIVFNTTYKEQNKILNGARKITRTPIAGQPPYVGATGGTPKGRFQLFGPAVSNRTFGQGTCATYDPTNPTNTLCDFTLINAPAAPSVSNFRNFKNTDRYDSIQYRSLQAPTKNVSAYVQGHYDIFNNVTFTANALYSRGESVYQDRRESPRVGLTRTPEANGQKIGISASNPYNPFGVDLVADTSNPCIAAGTCIGLSSIYRRGIEAKPRMTHFTRDSFHVFAGFNGFVNLFQREIDWNVGFAQNRVQSLDTLMQTYNNLHTQRGLGPVSQCTSPCVPINVFGGPGTFTPDQFHYLEFDRHTIGQGNLRDWTANLSSDVYDLPAGPLGVAVGYERIDNYGYTRPDELIREGNAADQQYGALKGRVARNAEYAELNIPLLADLPGAKSLSVDIANRWTQFERSGGPLQGPQGKSFVHNSSGRLNIRWQVINDLLLRASWSQGFRSPTVGDLFGGQTRTFVGISDPCAPAPNGGFTGGALPPNCPNGSLDVQPNRNINGIAGSNANLQPESSLSRTFGFVYSPSQVPGLDINADYFKIELNNAIGSVGEQSIINGCFNTGSFCDLLTITGNEITNVRNVSTNIGGLLTEGVDVGLHYKFPSTPIGDFDARINGTFLKTFDTTNVNLATKTGFATSHLAGAGERPKRRFNGYLNWDYGNWSAQYRIEYIGSTVTQCSVSIPGYCTYPNRQSDFQGAAGQFSLGRQHLGATVYHDVNVDYTVPSINTTFALGVQNLFDKKPPIDGSGSYDRAFYRLPSRLVYGSVRVRF